MKYIATKTFNYFDPVNKGMKLITYSTGEEVPIVIVKRYHLLKSGLVETVPVDEVAQD